MSRALAILLAAASVATGQGSFEDLIRRAVKDDGVDYAVFRGEQAREELRSILENLVIQKHVRKIGEGNAWSDADWINGYNASVLVQVLDGKSPKEACKVLEEFEAKITDPRIHFALHRAARSSPKLRYYKDNTLDGDLDEAVRAFLIDERHNEFSEARLDAELSEIFRWHEAALKPFQLFLARYAPRASLARRLKRSRWHFTFRKFDWTLNQAGAAEKKDERGSSLLWVYLVPAGLLLLYGLHSFRALLRRRNLRDIGRAEDLD